MPSQPSDVPGPVMPDGHVKLLLVGEVFCGKTWMWNVLKSGSAKPDVFKPPYMDVTTDSGDKVCLSLEEAPCQPEYSSIRSLSYADAGSVLLCFNLTQEESLSGIEKTWYPEVRKFNPIVPVFLVGNKRAEDAGEVAVTSEQAEAVLDRISGVRYFECTFENAEQVVPALLKSVAGSIRKVLPEASVEE